MVAYRIDPWEGTASAIDTDASLDRLYNLIGCECIDIAVRTVCGTPFNVVLDDEGLLKSDVRVAAVSAHADDILVGRLVVFGVADDGELRGLARDELDTLREFTFKVVGVDRQPTSILAYD